MHVANAIDQANFGLSLKLCQLPVSSSAEDHECKMTAQRHACGGRNRSSKLWAVAQAVSATRLLVCRMILAQWLAVVWMRILFNIDTTKALKWGPHRTGQRCMRLPICTVACGRLASELAGIASCST